MTLPPLHTVLFGGFQVGHIEIHQPSNDSGSGSNTESCVDLIYGSDKSQFSGVHRFSVIRGAGTKSKEENQVCVRYSSISCNPTVNKSLPSILFEFHRIYGNLLYREGVSEVMRWLGVAS